MEGCKLHPVPGSAPVLLTTSNCHTRHPLTSSGVPALVQQHSLLTKHVLKTTHFVNSHFADSILSSDWSTVTILCSDWSTVSAKCEFTKCVVLVHAPLHFEKLFLLGCLSTKPLSTIWHYCAKSSNMTCMSACELCSATMLEQQQWDTAPLPLFLHSSI